MSILINTSAGLQGDLNFNLLQPTFNTGINFVTNMTDKNLRTLITNATRVVKTTRSDGSDQVTRSLLDHLWSSYDGDEKSFIISHPISDHYPCMSVLKIGSEADKKEIIYRTFHEIQIMSFKNEFKNFLRDSCYLSISCAETLTKSLLDYLVLSVRKLFPQLKKILNHKAI